ncbi:hypothetical protein IKS57_04170 [bacterium]|nr:hypothetical protein [bacterium]
MFIFATTEINKIPKTILSRCQIYNLNSLSISNLMQLLNNVCNKEIIKISEDAKLVLCELANNSARNLLSLLEQLIQISKDITLTLIEQTFLLSNKQSLFDLLISILNHDEKNSLLKINNLTMKGLSIYNLCESLLDLSIQLYTYLLFKEQEVIKPSNYLLFKKHDLSNKKDSLKDLIVLLQPLILQLKQSNNQLLIFSSLLIKFFNENKALNRIENRKETEKNKSLFSNKKTIEENLSLIDSINENKDFNNNKEIIENNDNNSSNEQIINNDEQTFNPVSDAYLDSFVINELNTKNKIKTSKKEEIFINNAIKRISELDES